jgi:myo-inositol-1(or 4)-monophosphatase
MQEFLEYKAFTKHLAELSGDVIKKYFRTKASVDIKNDNSPVTIADKKAEEAMRELIMKEYPAHGIIGEEFGEHQPNADYKWVLDPIDGTKSFICGTVNFGTLIALLKNGEPILGVFNQPILNEYLIGDNFSAKLNGSVVQMRDCEKLSDAVLLTTDYLNIEKYQDISKFNQLIRKVHFFRGWGDCYGYYLLATGFADIMIDPIMSFWDIAAIVPIINGAGGIITDYHGNDPMKGNSIIASASNIHSQVIAELK